MKTTNTSRNVVALKKLSSVATTIGGDIAPKKTTDSSIEIVGGDFSVCRPIGERKSAACRIKRTVTFKKPVACGQAGPSNIVAVSIPANVVGGPANLQQLTTEVDSLLKTPEELPKLCDQLSNDTGREQVIMRRNDHAQRFFTSMQCVLHEYNSAFENEDLLILKQISGLRSAVTLLQGKLEAKQEELESNRVWRERMRGLPKHIETFFACK